jgi:hypothetical protein
VIFLILSDAGDLRKISSLNLFLFLGNEINVILNHFVRKILAIFLIILEELDESQFFSAHSALKCVLLYSCTLTHGRNQMIGISHRVEPS